MLSNLTMSIVKFRFIAAVLFLLALLLAMGCRTSGRHENTAENTAGEAPDVKESLIKANRYLIRSEEEDIDDFVRRRGWKMEKTGTGLRYSIETAGKGNKARYGQRVTLAYKVLLLTGDVIYDSNELGYKQFTVGRGGVETGLEEGILLLRKGDKAKFILPSHLAYGLLGDSEKIPPRTPIVYLIEVVDIQ